MNPRYPAIAQRAAHRCEYCLAPEAVFNFRFEVEHIIRPGAGGTDADSNLALACRACNVSKSNHTRTADPDSGVVVEIFHPRQQRWKDHFRVNENGVIVGKSPSGRATVACLQMNSPQQTTARRHWIRLEIYP